MTMKDVLIVPGGREMSFQLRNKIWLENAAGQPIVGEGRLRIFCAIRRTGSILKAARTLGLPYRNVWAKIKDAEEQCGFKIVETSNRGSRLTAQGEQLVRKYDELQRTCKRSARAKFRKLFPGEEPGSANPGAADFLCEPRVND
jgi:molybdate transport system regulatory protein